MEPSTKKTILTVIAAVVIVIAGYFFLSGSGSLPGSSDSEVITAPTISQDQLLGKAPLSNTQNDAISAHKAEILARVATGVQLTPEERGAIGNIMLTEAHLYKFTDVELEAIFTALRRQ
ncbi:MAG: hypothetical protein Q7R93_00595 [bacterium]|nr:hypothetical protein [bacterium]